jgi:hypothetical protein
LMKMILKLMISLYVFLECLCILYFHCPLVIFYLIIRELFLDRSIILILLMTLLMKFQSVKSIILGIL